MDAAAKLYNSNVYFFSLFSGGLNEMESRQQRCSPSLVIHSDKIPKNLPRVFSEIDYLLTKRKRINGNNCFEFYEVIDDAISRGKCCCLQFCLCVFLIINKQKKIFNYDYVSKQE